MAEDPKQIKDYSEEVKQQVPLIADPAEKDATLLSDAIEKLLGWEKKTRKVADVESSKVIVKRLLELIIKHKDWKSLQEHVALICKRHAQLRQVITSSIQQAMETLKDVPDEKTRMDLIDVLREVSKGKMFVELEFARLSRMKSEFEETKGDVSNASEILQEVQVETVGSMELEEKCEFLLEQFRLCLDNKDFVRSDLVMKKVAPEKLKENEKTRDLKLRYYLLQIRYFKTNTDYLEVCKAYQRIFEIKKTDPDGWQQSLKNAVFFIAMAPFDSEVSDLRHRLKNEKLMSKLDTCKKLLELLTTDVIMQWPLESESEFKNEEVFTEDDEGDIKMAHESDAKGDAPDRVQQEEGGTRWNAMKKSVIQHNIRVISKYYTRISTTRLAFLLQLSEEDAEKYLSEMVQSKQMFAKIDRPKQIVVFQERKDADDILNEWSSDIGELLAKVDQCCHMIAKENMMHGIKA